MSCSLAAISLSTSAMCLSVILNLGLRTLLLIFRGQFVLDQFFHCIIGVPAQISNRHLGVFALAANHLGQLLASLFGHGRHGHADQVTHGSGVETQITVTDGFLDFGPHALFPRLHADGAGIEQADVGHLRDGGHVAVVIHLHRIEQTRIGPASADFGQTMSKSLNGLVHFAFHGFFDVSDGHATCLLC